MNEVVLIVLGFALLLGLMLLSLPKVVKPKRKQLDKQFVREKWEFVKKTGSAPDQSARFAVVEADKLLDHVLKNRGYRGETMGERLKDAGSDFSYRDDVWSAHKLRNKLVHEAHYQVDRRLVAKALSQFEQALKDLGAL